MVLRRATTVTDGGATAARPADDSTHTRPPFWARVADAASIALLAILLRVITVGPVRERFGAVRLTISSPARVLVLLALVVVARHVLVRRPTLATRVWSGIRGWWQHPHSGAVLTAAALTRGAVLVTGIVAISAFGVPRELPHITDNPVRNMVARWDSEWYRTIVELGYDWAPDGRQHNVVFFPAMPIAMGTLGRAIHWHPLHAGLVVALAAFAAAATYLYRLARESLDEERALAAVWLLAAYPFSVYYSVPYTESLYLLAVLGALYHFGRDEWGRAGAWSVIAGLSRPNGCFLSVVLALIVVSEAWRARRLGGALVTRRTVVQLAVASLPGVAMLGFTAYLYDKFGVPFLWLHAQVAWARTYTDVVELAGTRAAALRDVGPLKYLYSQPYEVANMAAAVFAIVMIIPVWLRLGLAYAAFVGLSVVPPLVLGGTTSIGRLTSTLFPIFMVLAGWCNTWSRTAVLVVFAVLQGLVAALFFTWKPMF